MTSSFVSRKDELLKYLRQDLDMRHSKIYMHLYKFFGNADKSETNLI